MTTLFNGPEWVAILRIGIGIWWIESYRHKDRHAWFQQQAGITWARSVVDQHRWPWVRTAFDKVVSTRPKLISYVVVYSELAIGLGLVFGVLTPLAAIGGALLNLLYFVLMVHDVAEQGQNSMMFLIQIVLLGTHAWTRWSIGNAVGLF